MKKLLVSLLIVSSLALSACGSPSYQAYDNPELGLSFDYPEGWMKIIMSEEAMIFSTDSEEDGLISFQVIQNPEALDLTTYLLANGLEEEANIEITEIQSYPAYQTEWAGIPESGEQGKQVFVDYSDKGLFIILSAVRTSFTDQESLDANFNHALETLSFQ